MLFYLNPQFNCQALEFSYMHESLAPSHTIFLDNNVKRTRFQLP